MGRGAILRFFSDLINMAEASGKKRSRDEEETVDGERDCDETFGLGKITHNRLYLRIASFPLFPTSLYLMLLSLP